MTTEEKIQRDWTMASHLAALAIFIVALPFGNIWGPLVVWLWKRYEIPAVDEHGKAAVNFHLSVLIYLALGAVFLLFPLFLLSFIPFLVFITVPLMWVISGIGSLMVILEVILSIVAGIRAKDGVLFRYPCSLRLIK